MLDPLYEKATIIVDLGESSRKVNEKIKQIANDYALNVASLEEVNGDANIIGVIVELDKTYYQALQLINTINIGKDIFLILPDKLIDIPRGPFLINSSSDKRLLKKVEDYIIKCLHDPIDASISRMTNGYSYTIKGDIKINPYPGLFISIDHPDGAGATTLCRNIYNFLDGENIKTFQSEEPTNEIFGGAIRSVLRGRLEMFLDSMQLLYTVDRIEHSRLLNSALKEGKVIIESRFALSTLAFSYKDIPVGFLIAANSRIYWPDINLLIRNISPDVSISRINKRLEKTEKFDNYDKLLKVNEGISAFSKLFTGITNEIDGTKPAEEVARRAIRLIKRHEKYIRIKEEL